MCRNTTILATALFMAAFAFRASRAVGQQVPAPVHNDVVIKNAIVMTVTHGNIKNGQRLCKGRQDCRGG